MGPAIARLPPSRHRIDDLLYIRVRKSGRRTWTFLYMRHGRRHEIGLGPYPAISLADARAKAHQMRGNLAAGKPPQTTTIFKDVAEAYIKSQRPGWHNKKHAWQWSRSLEQFAYPVIGKMPVDRIDANHMLAILQPIWATKNETASRVRGRIESILVAARVQGLRPDGTNPAQWRGHLSHSLPKRSRTRTIKHHAALSFAATKALYLRLAQIAGEAAHALRFLILTAARTGEVINATWEEIAGNVWTIPAVRMKAGRTHRVPLCDEALAILGPRGSGYLFQGKGGRPLSNMAMVMCLRRLGVNATVHGFRSTFRD